MATVLISVQVRDETAPYQFYQESGDGSEDSGIAQACNLLRAELLAANQDGRTVSIKVKGERL